MGDPVGESEDVLLSYPISARTPAPPGLPAPTIAIRSSQAAGDLSDTLVLTLCNHVGSHIDGPQHMRLGHGPLSKWIAPEGMTVTRVAVIDVDLGSRTLVTPAHLAPHGGEIETAALVLIRTGAASWRDADPDRYMNRNPGLGEAAARFLCEAGRNLRCVGIDSLSIAPMEHLDEGIRAHHVFFDRRPPVFLLEDVHANVDADRLCGVTVVPFWIEGADSCPCTVIAHLSGQTDP